MSRISSLLVLLVVPTMALKVHVEHGLNDDPERQEEASASPEVNLAAQFKPVDTGDCKIELKSDRGPKPCKKGENFGCSTKTHSMWAFAGCKGTFLCDGHRTECSSQGQGGEHEGSTKVCWCGE